MSHDCPGDRCTSLANGWSFLSVRHMGEQVAGRWTVEISDEFEQDVGRLLRWEMTLRGH